MARVPRTYFSISVSGRDRALLSIKEWRPEQLLISQREPPNIGWASNDLIGEAHFSVHASEEGSVTSITRKVERINLFGRPVPLSLVKYIPDSADGFATAIEAVARCDASSPQFDLKLKPSDTLVSLGSYDPKKTTLVYCIVLARKPRSIRELAKQRLRIKIAETGSYELGLIYGFQHMASSAFQVFTSTMSRSPMWDGKRVGNIEIETRSLSNRELFYTSKSIMQVAMSDNYKQIRPNLSAYQNEPLEIPPKWLRIHRS